MFVQVVFLRLLRFCLSNVSGNGISIPRYNYVYQIEIYNLWFDYGWRDTLPRAIIYRFIYSTSTLHGGFTLLSTSGHARRTRIISVLVLFCTQYYNYNKRVAFVRQWRVNWRTSLYGMLSCRIFSSVAQLYRGPKSMWCFWESETKY